MTNVFATPEGMWFLALVIPLFLWMFYMMTFRTSDWVRICENDRKHKDAQAARLGKMAKGGLFLARRFLKR